MRRNMSFRAWLSSMISKSSLSSKDSLMPKKSIPRIWDQIRCLNCLELKLGKIVRSTMMSLDVNWMTRETVFRELKFFSKNQWPLRVNWKDWPMMWRDFRRKLWLLNWKSRSKLQLMINWVSLSNKLTCSPRRRSKRDKTCKSYKWRSKFLKRQSLKRNLNTPEQEVENTWREMISDNTHPTLEERITITSSSRKSFKRSSQKLLF